MGWEGCCSSLRRTRYVWIKQRSSDVPTSTKAMGQEVNEKPLPHDLHDDCGPSHPGESCGSFWSVV